MSRYEFSLLQEVLLEKGAGVLGDLSQDILSAKSKEELDRIEGQFNLANQFLFKAGSL